MKFEKLSVNSRYINKHSQLQHSKLSH